MSKETDAKKHALKGLKHSMSEMGGGSLLDALKGQGPVKATVVAKDKKGLEEGLEKAAELMEGEESEGSDFDSMSKEDLIELLQSK